MALTLGNNANNGWTDHGDISAINGATALTLSFWIAVGPAVSGGPIRKGAMIFFQMDGSRNYWIREVGGGWDLLTRDGNVIPPDIVDWNHFGLVYDGSLPATSRLTLYKNAVSIPLYGLNINDAQGSTAATTAPTALPNTSPNTLQIGNANTSGSHGHVRFWSAALTAAEIERERLHFWAARPTSLLVDAPYDDGLWAKDYSANAAHGTPDLLNGTPTQRQGPPIPYGGKVLVTG